MKKRALDKEKKSLPVVMALVTVIVLFMLLSVLTPKQEPIIHGIMDFYGTSKEVSLSELLDVVDNHSISVYLPSEVPEGLKLTAIYLKESSFIAIVVYSAVGNKDYKSAEFGIQIAHIGIEEMPTYEELQSQAEKSENKQLLVINGWLVMVDEKAYAGNEIFGEYCHIVRAYIEGNRYTLAGSTLTSDELIPIAQSMILQTP